MENKTKDLYKKLNNVAYFMAAPDYWYEDIRPEGKKWLHNVKSYLMDVLCIIYLSLAIGSYFTQHNLNPKQKSDQILFAYGHTTLYLIIPAVMYNVKKIRSVCYTMSVELHNVYNDPEIEVEMVKEGKFYFVMLGILIASTLFMFGLGSMLKVVTEGTTFVTVVTAWPDVDDHRLIAGAFRVLIYITWWLYTNRLCFVGYFVVSSITICLSHRFKNLCSYFRSLSNIFDNKELTHEEKEQQFITAFKVGIQLHSDTLRCTRIIQDACYMVYSIQTIANVTVVLILMLQMVNTERSVLNGFTMVVTISCVLMLSGCLWWTASNVTVEANQLSTAMFHSGWHHCRNEVAREIRSMLVIAMWHSQRPVVLRCLGMLTLSYQSFVLLVRASYSMFSVLY